MSAKVAIITCGWKGSTTSHRFDVVAKAYEAKGYKVVRYTPAWLRHTMSDWVDGLTYHIDEHDGADISLCGFSLGGMASLIASTERTVESLVLCSPSGFFKEFLPLIDTEDLNWCGARRLANFRGISFDAIIQKVRVGERYVIAGDMELAQWPAFNAVVQELENKGKFHIQVPPHTHHDISMPNYRKAISETLAKIK